MSTTTRETYEKNTIAVFQIHAGDSDGAEIVFECNGKRIAVSVFSSHSFHHCHNGKHTRPIEDHLIDLLGKAVDDDFDDKYDDIVDEVLDVIFDAGRSIFAQVAPLLTPRPSNHNQVLHSLLYPETLKFRLQTIDSKPTISPINPNEAYTNFDPDSECDIDSDFQINSNLPQYPSDEIRILEIFLRTGAVSRVLVNGQEMLCKAQPTGLLNSSLNRELTSLQKIEKAFSGSYRSIRVPKLLGYFKHSKNGHIVGLLREWIPSGIPGSCLSNMQISKIRRERRKKWVAQIRETVDQLHKTGVVWGDGKARNVIIDNHDNAWLIDFGGGWTEGWVDERLADTVEGDKQAVRSLIKFLDVGR